MKSILRLAFGALLGATITVTLWTLGWVQAPESVVRRVVIFSTLYPAPRGDVTLDPIECPPLRPARLWVVCTENCEAIWRVVLVRGLSATLLIDEGRLPPESESASRQRINTVIRAQELRLDRESARGMIGCYLRLEGLTPTMVLPPGGMESVEAARAEGEEALRALAGRLVDPDPLARIDVRDTAEGFEGAMFYWDRSRDGWPILKLTIALAPNGEVRSVAAAAVAAS